MRKVLAATFVMLAISLCAGLTHAASAPLVLAHTLTGYRKGDTGVTLAYSLHVANKGNSAITEVSLSLVPLPPVVGDRPTVNVGYLGPHEETDLTVQLQTQSSLDEKRSAAARLYWAARYVNAEGKVVEIPLQSRAGGAK